MSCHARTTTKVKPFRRSKPLPKERLNYKMEMEQINKTNCGSEFGKPESLRRPNISWTEREQKAWLNTYGSFMDKKQLTKEACKWKSFSKQLKDRYDIDKDNIQCAKQVNIYIVSRIILL